MNKIKLNFTNFTRQTSIHWYGPDNKQHVVIFVHGFGVNYTSKGLFSDLANHLADNQISSALFDLSDYDPSGNCLFLPFSQQQARLRWVYQQVLADKPQTISIIGHSMGCGLVATLLPEIRPNQLLLLAPTGVDHPGPRIKQWLTKSYNAQLIEKDLFSFKRRNGTNSFFSEQYISDLDIKFSDYYRQNLGAVNKLQIYLAESDNYQPDIMAIFNDYQTVTVPKADHNFTGSNRTKILKLSLDFLI